MRDREWGMVKSVWEVESGRNRQLRIVKRVGEYRVGEIESVGEYRVWRSREWTIICVCFQ